MTSRFATDSLSRPTLQGRIVRCEHEIEGDVVSVELPWGQPSYAPMPECAPVEYGYEVGGPRVDLPWEYTSYALRRESGPFAVEPGSGVSPFPDPVTFARGPVVIDHTRGLPVRHKLVQPCSVPRSFSEIEPFAIGRIVSGIISAQPDQDTDRRLYRGEFSLSCAFGVARVAVPPGETLGGAFMLQSLKVRLAMGRPRSFYDNDRYPYEHDVEKAYYHAYHRRSLHRQRFDHLRWKELPADLSPSCLDQKPREPRTIAIGAGWELPDRASAFEAITSYEARPLLAVDCRKPPGWCCDFDLSGLLDWPAPDCGEPGVLWIGVWVTSDDCHPIDYPAGIPPIRFPDADDPASTTYFLQEQSGVMGLWDLLTS